MEDRLDHEIAANCNNRLCQVRPRPSVNGSEVKSERMAVDCRCGCQGNGHETTTFSKRV